MKVLVTGANGFIGSHLTKALTNRNHQVISLYQPGTSTDSLQGIETKLFEGDITKPKTLVEPLKGVEIVFHLAALASDWGKWELFEQVNVIGTKNVIEGAIKAGTQRFVLMSSLAVHRYRGYLAGDETAPRDCTIYPYSKSKIMAEDIVNKAYKEGKIDTVIVRPAIFPFGPNDMTSFYHLAKALEKGLFGYVSGGRSKVCINYVENLVEGVAIAGEHPKAAGETFIIEDGVSPTWRDLIGRFAKELNVKPPFLNIPRILAFGIAALMEMIWKLFRISSPPPLTRYRIEVAGRDNVFIGEKARKILGYKPKISLEEGIKRTVKWYRSVT